MEAPSSEGSILVTQALPAPSRGRVGGSLETLGTVQTRAFFLKPSTQHLTIVCLAASLCCFSQVWPAGTLPDSGMPCWLGASACMQLAWLWAALPSLKGDDILGPMGATTHLTSRFF